MKQSTGLVLVSGAPASTTNILYLSGFSAPDPFFFLRTAREAFLVVSPMEKGRAQREVKPGIQVFTPMELGLKGRQAGRIANQIIALLKNKKISRVQVPEDFPVGLFRELQRRNISLSLFRGPVCPQRTIKTTDEIKYLRASQKAAVAAMKSAIELIASARIGSENRLFSGKEALTSQGVRQCIHKTLIENDCAGFETIVAGGDQATDPHERGTGPLFAGKSIILDIFPQSEKTGYWGDITRTVCRGPASLELKKMYRAVKAAQAAALRVLGPGVCSDKVHNAAKGVFAQRGYETGVVNGRNVGFIHGTGHGVGLEIHEAPRVSSSGEMLVPGNVITVEPGLYYPGLGGVRIEDTVVVTGKGWRCLAPYEKKFELL
jgi:Xaa-Pro aminopeptidase